LKLTVFGATGATGKLLVEQALAAGNQVVACVRNPSKIKTSHERLTIVQGELSDLAAIERAIHGAEAVISALGPRPGEDRQVRPLTGGMQNILAAMQTNGVRRLIVLSTPSASDPNDLPELKFRFLVRLIKTVMRPAYEEIFGVAQLVRASDTDWTVVRVSMLNNNPGTGKVRAGYLGRKQVGTNISRADLAAFLLGQVRDAAWLRQAPVVSN
jgi:putative NADH-flavin reductase